jgi:hypothetical protein
MPIVDRVTPRVECTPFHRLWHALLHKFLAQVLVSGWMGSTPKHLRRFRDAYHARGCDVFEFSAGPMVLAALGLLKHARACECSPRRTRPEVHSQDFCYRLPASHMVCLRCLCSKEVLKPAQAIAKMETVMDAVTQELQATCPVASLGARSRGGVGAVEAAALARPLIFHGFSMSGCAADISAKVFKPWGRGGGGGGVGGQGGWSPCGCN